MEHVTIAPGNTGAEDEQRPISAFALNAFAAALEACKTDETRLAPLAVGIPAAQELLKMQYGYEAGIAELIAERAGRYAIQQTMEASPPTTIN